MLIDTSGLLCCLDSDEARHKDAVRYYHEATQRISHNYVLAEFIALAQARRLPRHISLSIATDMLTDPEVEVVWVEP